jgi:hypothetical protein
MEGMEDGDARPRQVRYVFRNVTLEIIPVPPSGSLVPPIPVDNSPIVQQSRITPLTRRSRHRDQGGPDKPGPSLPVPKRIFRIGLPAGETSSPGATTRSHRRPGGAGSSPENRVVLLSEQSCTLFDEEI